jgi:hypothetical protein
VSPARRGRAGQRGLFRGCCIGIVALVVVCAGAVVLLIRLTSSPTYLAAPLAGPDDGSSTAAIAAVLAPKVSTELTTSTGGHAVVTLSEHDLSVIAAQENPDPDSFSSVQVRSRGGYLLVSADSHVGPLAVVITARLVLSLQRDGSVTVSLEELDVGDQAIPGFMRSTVDPRGSDIFQLASLLRASGLSHLDLDCLAVVSGGVALGFHSPGASADRSTCASP